MLLTVVANLYHPEEDVLTAQERERGLDRMILLGLDTLVSE
jgi:purine-nucleoside phosphorylase